MRNNTILVLADMGEPQLPLLREQISDARIVVGNSAAAFVEVAASAGILFNWSGSLELFKQVFRMCQNLLWVHSRAVGLERTLFPELIESAVPLTNSVGVFSASLGEFVVGAMLYFAKDFRRMMRSQQSGVWDPFDVGMIEGATLGIVGLGDIGRTIATRARAMGLTVLGLRRHIASASEADPLVTRMYSSEQRLEMLSQCDYVAVATPLTPETRGMIGEAELAAMKPTAVIINVGRGPVINEGALVGALSSGRIKGAALDVFDQEPLPAGHPFYKLENVLLSPHCADHTADWLDDAMKFFIEQFRRLQKGEPLQNVVDKKLGY